MLLAWEIEPPGELMVTKSAVGRWGQDFWRPLAMLSVLDKMSDTVFGWLLLRL